MNPMAAAGLQSNGSFVNWKQKNVAMVTGDNFLPPAPKVKRIKGAGGITRDWSTTMRRYNIT